MMTSDFSISCSSRPPLKNGCFMRRFSNKILSRVYLLPLDGEGLRGDGLIVRSTLSRPFPIKGKGVRPTWGRRMIFSSSVGERKLMNHFVVISPISVWFSFGTLGSAALIQLL
jgi:hypothetical protein